MKKLLLEDKEIIDNTSKIMAEYNIDNFHGYSVKMSERYIIIDNTVKVVSVALLMMVMITQKI